MNDLLEHLIKFSSSCIDWTISENSFSSSSLESIKRPSQLTSEVRIAVPVLLPRPVQKWVSNEITVVGIVLQGAELLPQSAINFLGAVIDFYVLEESFSKYAHTVMENSCVVISKADGLIKYL